MRLVRDILERVTHPAISSRRDLAAYVISTTLVCLILALSADVTNQLVFFESWESAFRSWAITCTIVMFIAAPVSFFIGRTHLQLRAAQELISQQLAALEQAHEATEAAHKLAQSLARHDALTGLPNRILYHDRLQHTIDLASRDKEHFAVAMLDLNGFKEINDRRGHLAGDRILQEVSSRISTLLRASDTVARLGGDEFAFVLPTVDKDAPHLVAEKILSALDEPIELDDGPAKIFGSIGIALYPGHSIDNDGLLALADAAMYTAKRQGGGVCVHGTNEVTKSTK